MESCNNNTTKLVGALFLGAAIGGALAILFAPDKGSKTRKDILNKGEDLTDAIKEKFNDFVKQVKKDVASVTDKANEVMEQSAVNAGKLNRN